MTSVDRLETIDLARARPALRALDPPVGVVAVDECGSTNDVAAKSARAGEALPFVVLTDEQTGGRGRQGAAWISPRGASLPLSIVWRFSRKPAAMGGLSLAIGVACAEALERCGVPRVELKWPNDLLVNGAKLGGILVESRVDSAASTLVIAGIGINVALPREIGQRLDRPVTSVSALVALPPDLTAIAVAIVSAVAPTLARFDAEGFVAFRDRWESRHAWQGAEVRVLRDGRVTREGRAMGVAEDGALMLATAEGSEIIHAAEVSLRAAP